MTKFSQVSVFSDFEPVERYYGTGNSATLWAYAEELATNFVPEIEAFGKRIIGRLQRW